MFCAKFIIHQKALYDIFYEKVVKWCKIKQIIKNILADIVIRTISAQDIFDYENARHKFCLFSLAD